MPKLALTTEIQFWSWRVIQGSEYPVSNHSTTYTVTFFFEKHAESMHKHRYSSRTYLQDQAVTATGMSFRLGPKHLAQWSESHEINHRLFPDTNLGAVVELNIQTSQHKVYNTFDYNNSSGYLDNAWHFSLPAWFFVLTPRIMTLETYPNCTFIGSATNTLRF